MSEKYKQLLQKLYLCSRQAHITASEHEEAARCYNELLKILDEGARAVKPAVHQNGKTEKV